MSRLVCHRQQMGKHHLYDALRTICGYVGHRDATFVSRLNVHDVIASSQYADVFQTRQLFHLLFANNHLVRQHDVSLCCPCYRLLRTCTVIDLQLAHLPQLVP